MCWQLFLHLYTHRIAHWIGPKLLPSGDSLCNTMIETGWFRLLGVIMLRLTRLECSGFLAPMFDNSHIVCPCAVACGQTRFFFLRYAHPRQVRHFLNPQQLLMYRVAARCFPSRPPSTAMPRVQLTDRSHVHGPQTLGAA